MKIVHASIALAACATACSGSHVSQSGDSAGSTAQTEETVSVSATVVPSYTYRRVCADPGQGKMRCLAYQRADFRGEYGPFASPQDSQGFTPSDLRAAYDLPSSGGNGRLVAIVDAYDYADAESDLATYRSQFGLPPCSSQNGCFTKVNQQGQASPLPQQDQSWAGEISLDLDMVSAVCPDCKILLVEASGSDMDSFGASVDTAVKLGAVVVSNSYGGRETSDVTSGETHYDHPGVSIFVSSGDDGYGVMYPAASAHVIAVGGTSLAQAQNSRGWSETAWSDGSSGCSQYIGKPAWQTDTGCSRRTVADVSAVGDPNTGVAIYQGGWQVYGGTSVSSPIVAASFALLGLAGVGPDFVYAHSGDWFDVTSGSDGQCGGSYLCTAGQGFDGPTGWGTPDGTLLATAAGDAGAPPPPADAGAPPPGDAGPPSVDAGGPPPGDAGGGPSCTPEQDPGAPIPQPLHGAVCGALSGPGDTDAYSFTVAQGGSFDVTLQATGDAALILFQRGPFGWSPVPTSSPTDIASPPSSGGDYVVVVDSPTGAAQSYRITLK